MIASAEAHKTAAMIVTAFEWYNAAFRRITRRAANRFDLCDWKSLQRDAVQRIELYEQHVSDAVEQVRTFQDGTACDRDLWRQIRSDFDAGISHISDQAFARTFFSSIARRLFGVTGVDPELEFLADLESELGSVELPELRRHVNRGSVRELLREVLRRLPFRSPWENFERSLTQLIEGVASAPTIDRIDVLEPLFYQRTRAYLVGRIRGHVPGRDFTMPLVIALSNHPSRGIAVDAVLAEENDVSMVFGFARSYFHADLTHVGATVRFLRSILPRKPVSELFTVLGRVKQGKAERFRELMLHLSNSDDRFVHAPGERGLVMVCFTLPSYDIVFKVIRDHIPYPKTVGREEVQNKYKFVFRHDRAGRLVDAQEYRRLRFPLARMDPALVEELKTEAASTVHVSAHYIVLDHVYVERRMTPLNLYLARGDAEHATIAVHDYGRCLRDLAHSDIFPGDLLLKNFGVTRHGRVIFYDYDELCTLTECRFRDLPQPRDDEDEMRGEEWFYVGEHDVFPETFLNFLSFNPEQRELFLSLHADLLTAGYWRNVQERLATGEVLEILPYGS